MCPSILTLSSSTAHHSEAEYKKKLIHGAVFLPDPMTLAKKGWESEELALTKWPPIYYHDIATYLEGINSPGDLLHRLSCDYKEGKTYRYFACDFVKEIFYHPHKIESNFCFLKTKVKPSQRTSSTPYTVWAPVEKKSPEGKIYGSHFAHLFTCKPGFRYKTEVYA